MEDKYIQMIAENSSSTKSAHHRIDNLEKEVSNIHELTLAVKEIAMELKPMRADINDVNARLKSIEEKPAKNWENLIKITISGIATAVLGFLLGKFGL